MIYYSGPNKEAILSSTEKALVDLRKDEKVFNGQLNTDDYIEIIIVGSGKIFSERDLEATVDENLRINS